MKRSEMLALMEEYLINNSGADYISDDVLDGLLRRMENKGMMPPNSSGLDYSEHYQWEPETTNASEDEG